MCRACWLTWLTWPGIGFAPVRTLREDVEAAIERDPAASGWAEVVLFSPGMHALWLYRVAHWLWTADRRLAARALSYLARLLTGVEIHPAADIGRRVVIDHGIGVVIGATATVGDDVLIYHGVTLGSRRPTTGNRHPTIGDGVLLGAGATVLGPVEIGDGCRVGADALVLESQPPDTTVVGGPDPGSRHAAAVGETVPAG
ncbi:MAG: serine O-acetyltransferase [Haloferacaceae archaeon]